MNNDFNVWLNDLSVFVFNQGYILTNDPEILDTIIFLYEDDTEALEAANLITP